MQNIKVNKDTKKDLNTILFSKYKFISSLHFIEQKKIQQKNKYNFKPSAKFFTPQPNINPYVKQLYDLWLQNPENVNLTWQKYFSEQDFTFPVGSTYTRQQSLSPSSQSVLQQDNSESPIVYRKNSTADMSYFMKVYMTIKLYKNKGHQEANLDPLRDLNEFGKKQRTPINDELKYTEDELDHVFTIDREDFLVDIASKWTLREIINNCKQIYCGNVGFEYTHIENKEQRRWLQQEVEKYGLQELSVEAKLKSLQILIINEALNQFLKDKFNTSKRFGIEGTDSFVAGLSFVVESAANHNLKECVIGMPHRGRLNTLHITVRKRIEQIFAEFQDIRAEFNEEQWGNSGDVKYHLGATQLREYPNGKKNYCQAADPCVYGITRAIQDYNQDTIGDYAFGIVVHGDAAFSWQGIVYETMQFADLQGYSPRGVVHIVVNNQIGSCKIVEAPIFHVNADQPDQVDHIFQLAFSYRQKFKKDVVIDLIRYRRYGHNELDQPMFTQPQMYKQVALQKPVVDIYSSQLIEQGIITDKEIKQMMHKYTQELENGYVISKQEDFNIKEFQSIAFEQLKPPAQFGPLKDTCVPQSILKELGTKLFTLPETFNCHPLVQRILQQRVDSLQKGDNM